MSVSTDNNISVKEYNKISKYKDLEIEIEKKSGTLKQPIMTVIVGVRGMIKKGTDECITRYLALLAYMKYKIMYFAELLISFGEYCQRD